ncbi:MAG: ATP-dependent DNA helicase [Candidatus Competibacteraceae bacterium]
MARAVQAALSQHQLLLVEAGTGTGKTCAYLVPALLSGRKVIISTGTRNLQDQLYYNDLPLVRTALNLTTVKTALLKGRSNYLCRHRLALTEESGRWPDRRQVAEFARIRDWAGRTRHGDIAEVSEVPEDSPLWSQVTSTADNCLGQDCPEWQSCHLLKARRNAYEADVVVINHYLLFADLVLKEEGFGELLPGADAFILDEAHQLPEVAGHFFGFSLSSRQLDELARDTLVEQRRDAPDFPALAERIYALGKATADLRLALGQESRRAAWQKVATLPTLVSARKVLEQTLAELQQHLQAAAARGKGLENCWRRSLELSARLTRLTESTVTEAIPWFETYSRSFSLNLTPLDVAPHFRACLQKYPGSWILTSATLAVGDSFAHFSTRLGLDNPLTLRLDSPFDFARHALLYHPSGLPEPASPHYTVAMIEGVVPVLTASRGRAFLLFTSFRALREAAALLENRLEYPLLVQGNLPRHELLARFRQLGNAILLGTTSFWEGVDVRGEALSCVVIDKLPFASPGDPVLEGRIAALRQQGKDPFLEYQLPHAVIMLKQGVGRLIRDVHDRGVLVLCDPRLLSRSYGRVFLDSLPPMRRTRRLEEVQAFFAVPPTDFPPYPAPV